MSREAIQNWSLILLGLAIIIHSAFHIYEVWSRRRR